MRRNWVCILLAFLVMAVADTVTAGVPTDKIKETTDEIIGIVSDPLLKDPAKATERRMLIRRAVDRRFDWAEMARRSLARYWRERTDEEKRTFVEIFGKLLESTYLDKVEGYSGEKVIYVDEDIDGDYSVVRVKIITIKNEQIDVEYRLKKKETNWLVYDISVAGVSLVNNYRVQFSSILARSSFQDLVKRLKEKVAKQ